MAEDKLTPQVEEQTETLPILHSAKDLFEQIDTGELVADLEKRVTGAWAYEFRMDDKQVRGLSAAGARESAVAIAHQSGGQLVIRVIGLESMVEEPDCFKATVKAGAYVIGIVNGKPLELLTATSIGYAKQPKYGIRKDKTKWAVNHAEVIAVSKAERNAIAHLIPDKIRGKILEVALQTGRVEQEPVEASNNTPSSKSGDMATPKQIAYIVRLLKHEKVLEQQQADCEKAMKKGLSSTQASKWIQLLKDTIGEENGKLL